MKVCVCAGKMEAALENKAEGKKPTAKKWQWDNNQCEPKQQQHKV